MRSLVLLVSLFVGLLPAGVRAVEAAHPEAAAAPLATAEASDGKVAWRVKVMAKSDDRTSAVVYGAASEEAVRIDLPFDAGNEGWRTKLTWLQKVTGGPILAVEVFVVDEGEEDGFWAFFRPSKRAGGKLELIARSGRIDGAADGSWRLVDANDDGQQEVVVTEQDRRLASCSAKLSLHPRAIGTAPNGVLLHRASLGTVDRTVARREPAPVLDRFALDGAVSWVSHADASLGSPNAAAALHDNRDDTVWAPGGSNAAGEFAVIKMVEGVPLVGVTIGLPAQSAEATLLLHFGAATRRLVLAPGTTVTVRAPAPVQAGCTAVEVLSTRGRQPLLLSTIRPVTALDTEPVEAIFERVLLPILKRARSSGERSVIIRWLATAGPSLLPHLERALRDELGERQAVLVLTALEFEGGDELLAHLAVEGVLDDEAIATWSRTNRSLSDAAMTVVTAQFAEGAPDVRLIPLVARTPSEEGNRAFVGLMRSSSPVVRKAALAALPPNAPSLLAVVLSQALDGAEAERADWLETALKLSRHQRALEPGETAASVTASVDRLLASASNGDRRVGVTLVGALGLADRRDSIAELARHAENEWVRVAALQAVARWRGATEVQRNEASALLAAALRDNSPSVRMQAAQLLARESTLVLSLKDCLALLAKEPWQETRNALIRILSREAEADGTATAALVAWLREASERERRSFLEDFRPSVELADDRWLTLDAVTMSEPATRRALFFVFGRKLSAAQQRFAERVTADRLEPDEVRLAAATVLARSGLPSWRDAAAALLSSESAASAQRAAALLCTWTPVEERGALADAERYASPYAVVLETLQQCKGMGSDPSTGVPLQPR